MKTKDFFGKLTSRYVWGNLLAMSLVVVMLCLGVKYGLEIYTHHGEGIPVPNIKGMKFSEANYLLVQKGLRIEVSDSGYNRRLPADCILAQSPGLGTNVKSGHIIYVTVNSPSSPTFAIPDIIDNSSVREATAKLTAMGFKLLAPKYVDGEKVSCRATGTEGKGVQYSASENSSWFLRSMLDRNSLLYNIVFAALIIAFTYFYTAITLNPTQMAEDMKRNNGFIPGVKPGKDTADYIDDVMSRLTLPGSLFIAFIAIMPALAGLLNVQDAFSQFFGGTSLLILIGVVLDTLQQIESHLMMRHYDGLLNSGKVHSRTGVSAY